MKTSRVNVGLETDAHHQTEETEPAANRRWGDSCPGGAGRGWCRWGRTLGPFRCRVFQQNAGCVNALYGNWALGRWGTGLHRPAEDGGQGFLARTWHVSLVIAYPVLFCSNGQGPRVMLPEVSSWLRIQAEDAGTHPCLLSPLLVVGLRLCDLSWLYQRGGQETFGQISTLFNFQSNSFKHDYLMPTFKYSNYSINWDSFN